MPREQDHREEEGRGDLNNSAGIQRKSIDSI